MRGNQALITLLAAIGKPSELDHAEVVEAAQTGPQTALDGVQVEIPVLAGVSQKFASENAGYGDLDRIEYSWQES
jgi:hypothetical protein